MDARDKLGIPWQYSENEKHGMFLMAFENKAGLPVEPATFQLYVPALSAIWRDSGIREAFSRRSEFQLVSNLPGHCICAGLTGFDLVTFHSGSVHCFQGPQFPEWGWISHPCGHFHSGVPSGLGSRKIVIK